MKCKKCGAFIIAVNGYSYCPCSAKSDTPKSTMKCTKVGRNHERLWTGSCRNCGSEFEDTWENIKKQGFENYQRDGSFAHRACPQCGAKAGSAVILYPKGS